MRACRLHASSVAFGDMDGLAEGDEWQRLFRRDDERRNCGCYLEAGCDDVAAELPATVHVVWPGFSLRGRGLDCNQGRRADVESSGP